jgi:hypothetical protein
MPMANEEISGPDSPGQAFVSSPLPEVRQRQRWVAACDSYDDIDRATEALAKNIGNDSIEAAEACRQDCGCTKKILYAVTVIVSRVR